MMKLFGTLVTMNQNSGEATKLGQAPPKTFQCIWRASYEAESIVYK